jgi:hypothetical protein
VKETRKANKLQEDYNGLEGFKPQSLWILSTTAQLRTTKATHIRTILAYPHTLQDKHLQSPHPKCNNSMNQNITHAMFKDSKKKNSNSMKRNLGGDSNFH